MIPAVCHVDNTARPQTVDKASNGLYYQLITEFKKITNVPMLLNTSFNENEPIVNSPSQAIDSFLRTKATLLIMGNHFIFRFPGTQY